MLIIVVTIVTCQFFPHHCLLIVALSSSSIALVRCRDSGDSPRVRVGMLLTGSYNKCSAKIPRLALQAAGQVAVVVGPVEYGSKSKILQFDDHFVIM